MTRRGDHFLVPGVDEGRPHDPRLLRLGGLEHQEHPADDDVKGTRASNGKPNGRANGKARSRNAGDNANERARRPFIAPDDTVVFLGDYVDRGPDSPGVVATTAAKAARIAREAVGNAVRHGGATHVRLVLRGNPPTLDIEDDGTGFDPAAPRSPHSFGIRSMRERAESLGGELEIGSAPGEGTHVVVLLPQ